MEKTIAGLNNIFPLLMRYVGLFGVFYETIVESVDRPYLLTLFGTMMGISQVLEFNKGMKGGK